MSSIESNKVYFVGIGGVGMSALARYFKSKGMYVAGYDKTPSSLTYNLTLEGIDISYKDLTTEIPEIFVEDKNALIVYTPAIPKDNDILNYFIDNDYKILKRAQVLGLISKDNYTIAVAGTHGKTTTTAILAHILHHAQTGVNAFVGGIMNNYKSNFILGQNKLFVVEADEFDRSFLELKPNAACITSVDADHLDIYSSKDDFTNTFKQFADLVEDKTKLIVNTDVDIDSEIKYSVDDDAYFKAFNIRVEDAEFVFDISVGEKVYENIHINTPGRHNVSNSLAAFALAYQYGVDADKIIEAFKSFKGIQRRFNIFSYENKIIIDDYAHHPSEIKSALNAARELYPNKKIKGIFQPHLFSRTRDFMNEFAEELSKFDSLCLLDIYPAREMPIEGINSSALLDLVNNENKDLIEKSDIASEIKLGTETVVMMLGAGDIGVEIDKLRDIKC